MDYKNFTTDQLAKLNKIRRWKSTLCKEIEDLEAEFLEIKRKMKALGCIIDGRIEDPKTRNIRIGKSKFNHNPDEGIDYLIGKKILDENARSVSIYLTDRTLDKKCIGDYLGNISNPFHCQVLEHYIQQFDFTGMEFIDSIRFFLSGFHLPGESQKIDKIIFLWSKYFHSQNPGMFKNENETYIMTYAVIMLNTCLHNPTAKKENGGFGKEEDFIKIMKNFDSDTNFDLSFVKKIFQSIKSNPLSCLHKNMAVNKYSKELANMEKAGWLWKCGGRIKNLKKRWFVLSEFVLFYFIHPDSQNLKGMIPLEGVSIRLLPGKFGKFGLEIYSDENQNVEGYKADKDGQIIIGNHCSYKIYSSFQPDIKLWLEAIQSSINCINQIKFIKQFE